MHSTLSLVARSAPRPATASQWTFKILSASSDSDHIFKGNCYVIHRTGGGGVRYCKVLRSADTGRGGTQTMRPSVYIYSPARDAKQVCCACACRLSRRRGKGGRCQTSEIWNSDADLEPTVTRVGGGRALEPPPQHLTLVGLLEPCTLDCSVICAHLLPYQSS